MTKIEIIVNALKDINASDIIVFDTENKSPFFDYFVVSSITSDRQLQAAISHVNQDLAKNDFPHPVIEGRNSKSWVLIDCKDIIINIFTREERDYYNIEKMMVGVEQIEVLKSK
ncbi:MAG: ribosome silencing factor [Candidatus Izimaplasma sp.]|nr:ribosome silencing factor [Candidatus Izimaplasma bacterium]